nr:hypothetical protein [uncultured Draconibacterium sp.]
MESIAGSVNYKYVVLSDPTSSNNGYYHWNGSSYTKDASLSNGVISDSDPDPVSGGTVYDYLDDFTYLNISSLNGNYAYADLAEALAAVPQERRRPLCLISFRDSTSKPYFYYFLSSINQADNSV